MKIKFIPFFAENFDLESKPEAAVRHLPDWYKSLSPFRGDKKKFVLTPEGSKNLTIKWCNPFGDALGAGYFVMLENAVFVDDFENEKTFTWTAGGQEVVTTHDKNQIDLSSVPTGYNTQPYKFKNYWGVKLPKGYSAIFTHPMNRYELPFLTLSGIVDVDTYNNPVNFPFFIRNDFVGVIEAGTPIAQIVPFKRDAWSSSHEKFDEQKTKSMLHKFLKDIYRPYKRFYWAKKEYK